MSFLFLRRKDLEKFFERQEASQKATMEAVATIARASERQAGVLSEYLKLFQNAQQQPRRWAQDVDQEDKDYMRQQGYPVDASPEEQAKWLVEHANDI